MSRGIAVAGLVLATAFACAPPPVTDGRPAPGAAADPAAADAAPAPDRLPPIPARTGALVLDLVYPADGGTITAADSTFVFGSTGSGNASLWINGEAVDVRPNGAFLAFLPVPPDGRYHLEAVSGAETDRLTRTVDVPAAARAAAAAAGDDAAPGDDAPAPADDVPPLTPPADAALIQPGSIQPTGTLVARRGEPLTVSVRARSGGRARLILPDGRGLRMVAQSVSPTDQGFMQERPAAPREYTEYSASFPLDQPLRAADPDVEPSALVPPSPAARAAVIEFVHARDTVRTPLDLTAGILEPGEFRVGVTVTDRPDGLVGRAALPPGTPYHWFFPTGTQFTITGERAGHYRVELTDDLSIWVAANDVRLRPIEAAAPLGSVGAIRVRPGAGFSDVVITTSQRMPFHVEPDGDDALLVTVYGARARTNWIYQESTDPLIRRIDWRQESDREYRVRIDLAESLWGWLTSWDDAGNLVLRVRRPPRIDPDRPLAGLYVGVDAGHPPGGAIGPTRLTEAEANLAISRLLVAQLRERGARVLEIRPDTAAVALGERPQMAIDSSVHLLVSVHNNAFPDGVNPFERNGTSVLYNRPQSVGLARHLQRELLVELGLRDLGVIWADLALARPTWMPAALTETMFLMIPRQEAALRDPAVHERIASAHVRALEAFLRERAAEGDVIDR